jgi:hypothetical protein
MQMIKKLNNVIFSTQWAMAVSPQLGEMNLVVTTSEGIVTLPRLRQWN